MSIDPPLTHHLEFGSEYDLAGSAGETQKKI